MPEKDNIILIGLPGAGKSTLGIVLAKILNYSFVDADLLIQEQTDKTLQMIIDAMGPAGFIEVENEVLKQIERRRTIIATGGSAVYSDEAMQHLKSIGTVVQLKISYDELERRLGDLDERGVVLRNGKVVELHELYDERTPLYDKYADYTIDVSDVSVREAAAMLGQATAVLVCWEEAPETASLREAVHDALLATCTPAADARIAVVVGPEGGLAEEEVCCFLGCNARARLVTLGPSILRTETAGIVAPALVLYELGGMGNRPSPTYEGNRG